VSDSAQAQAPFSLATHERITWISKLHSSQTYTSPAFISLHAAIVLTFFQVDAPRASRAAGAWSTSRGASRSSVLDGAALPRRSGTPSVVDVEAANGACPVRPGTLQIPVADAWHGET